jgi:hypothetical protein
VVESTSSPNPSKYRAVDEAQAHGARSGGEDNAAAVADEDFDWLEPKDFVAAYKASEHYAHVIDTINDTNKNLNAEHGDDHKVRLGLPLGLSHYCTHIGGKTVLRAIIRPRSSWWTTPAMPNTPPPLPRTPHIFSSHG